MHRHTGPRWATLLALLASALAWTPHAVAQGDREVERMVQCAHCGVNQPISESLLANGRYYCCAAHLRESGHGGD